MKLVNSILTAAFFLGTVTPARAEPAEEYLKQLSSIDQILAAARAELEEKVDVPAYFPPSDSLLQAFLVEPPTVVPLQVGPLWPCEEVRLEKRRMMLTLRGLRSVRQAAEADLRAFQKSGGNDEAARVRLDGKFARLRADAEIVGAYHRRVYLAEPDRAFIYRLRLQGGRARSLEAYYEAAPEVKLLRVRFAARRWMDFPTESYSVHEGLQGPPVREADGLTWTLRRNLSAYQACTKNLAFALEFLTRWNPRPGTPGVSERAVTVRTHAWVYDR
jgi:hypothetical protein